MSNDRKSTKESLDTAIENTLNSEKPTELKFFSYESLIVVCIIAIFGLAYCIICQSTKGDTNCIPEGMYWLIGFFVFSILTLIFSLPIVISSKRKQNIQFILDIKDRLLQRKEIKLNLKQEEIRLKLQQEKSSEGNKP